MIKGRIPTKDEAMECVIWDEFEIEVTEDGEVWYDYDIDQAKIRELGLNPKITEEFAEELVNEAVKNMLSVIITEIREEEDEEDDKE